MLLVFGNGVSSFGNAVYLIAMILYLKEIDGSAVTLGVFQFLALIPGFLMSPLSGVFIDRWSRRRILIVSDAIRGGLMLLAGVLLFSPFFQGPWLILLVSFLMGMGHAFFVPAAQAIIPEIVSPEGLARANSLRVGGSQLTNMTGHAVGGILFVLLGARFILIINGVSFLISALQESLIRTEPHLHPGSAGRRWSGIRPTWADIRGDMGETFRYLQAHRDIGVRIVSQGGMFLLSPVFLLTVPFLLIDGLGAPEHALGFIFASALAGGIVTFVVLSKSGAERLVTIPVIPAAYGVFGILFLVPAVYPGVVTLVGGAFLAGGAAGAVYLSATVGIQHAAPPALHGRLFAVMEGVSAGIAPAAYLVTGVILEQLGPGRYGLLFAVAAVPALVWAGLSYRLLRQVKQS